MGSPVKATAAAVEAPSGGVVDRRRGHLKAVAPWVQGCSSGALARGHGVHHDQCMVVTAAHLFRLQGMWISADAAGYTRTVQFHGHRCTLRLPTLDGELGEYAPHYDDRVFSRGRMSADNEFIAVGMEVIRIDVELDSHLQAGSAVGDGSDPMVMGAFDLLGESDVISQAMVESFVTEIRVHHGQFWLEPPQYVHRIASELRDEANTRFPVVSGGVVTVQVDDAKTALSTEQLDSILSGDFTELNVHLADSLLTDARFIALRAPHPNLHMGLLLAAIATEVNVKAALLDVARPEQYALVNLILENPRDWSMAVAALFDKAMAAVSGVSLRDADKEIYKAVERLFQDRNKFAHRGDVALERERILEDLRTATAAFDWLDAQRARASNSQAVSDSDGES